MGASASSAVIIHSTDVETDRDTLLLLFPSRFQVEAHPRSKSILLFEGDDGQLTLIVTPSPQARGTYACLTLEDDVLQQLGEQSDTHSIEKVVQTVSSGEVVVKLRLPGGAMLLATTPQVWNDASARNEVLDTLLPSQADNELVETRKFVELNRSPNTPRQKLSPSNSGMPRTLSLPSITDVDNNNNNNNETRSTTPRSGARLFPSLQTNVLSFGGNYQSLPLNSKTAIPVESDLFIGSILLIMRPSNPNDDPYWNERIFSNKKRRIILQMQGKLKRKPKGTMFAGLEISKTMNLGLLASGLCNILLKLLQKFNPHIHYSFGDDSQRAHIVFPASTFFERLVVTPPGERVPPMGEEFEEPMDVVKSRKAYKTKIDWNTEDTYSMSFHSMYMDFPSWSVVNLPIGRDAKLKTFWGDALASIVFYDVEDESDKPKSHLMSAVNYFLGVQMNYLGKRGQENLAIDEQTTTSAWSEERFVEIDMESVSTTGEVGLGLATPIFEDDAEDDLYFFDAAQNLSGGEEKQSPGSMNQPIEITTTTSYASLLTAVDKSCPCVIDMCFKKGKYVSVYVFQSKRVGGRPYFRSMDQLSGVFGDFQDDSLDERFSPRLSLVERQRRFFSLKYNEARLNRGTDTRLDEFEKIACVFEGSFLRPRPKLAKKVSGVNSEVVARAVSDRRWVEEFCVLSEEELLFYHPDKTKPAFRIGLPSIVRVDKLDRAKSLDLPFAFLAVETFGRTTYLMYRSIDLRDTWGDAILKLKQSFFVPGISSSNSFTNHLVEVDEPTVEFMHKSSMWDCQKRKILNCRRYSFRTSSDEEQPSALALSEIALIKATALQPKGPNDSDLEDFLDSAAALKEADAYPLTDLERTAFFLNVYHVMIMHAFIVLGPPDTFLKWASYFNNIAYQVSDDIFSLAELEHNIIRAQMSYPSQFLSRFVLPKSKYNFSLLRRDFRINFALNCGSLSIPSGAVPVYRPETLEEQLDSTARRFLSWTTSVKPKGPKDVSVTLPRVIQWFSEDFGDGNASDIIKCIVHFLSEEKLSSLNAVWNERRQCYGLGMFGLKYLSYNFECRYLTLLDE